MAPSRNVVRRQRSGDAVEMKPLATAVDDDDEEDGEPISKGDQWMKWALYKLHALLWIIIAGALAAWTQLPQIIVDGHPPLWPLRQLNRFFFNVGLAGFCAWMLMAMYLILWVKYVKKFPGEWEEYWPQSIPIATVCAVGSLIAFVIAFWPVWGWFTLPTIFVLFLGVLNLAHFVPL